MGNLRNGPGLKFILGGVALGVLLMAGISLGMRMTDQRPFCAGCHVMNEAAVTHKMSTHANLACNDCHAPVNLVSRLPFKAAEGLRDFIANTQKKDVPIVVAMRTKDVINANCKTCHAMTNIDVASMEAKPYCIDCHRSIAHMRQKPISIRMVADE